MDKQTGNDALEIAVDFAPADPVIVASEPAADTPEPPTEPPVASGKRGTLRGLRDGLPLVLAGLAIFAALVATIGLIVVSRNVAETNARIAALQTALEGAAVTPAAMPARVAPAAEADPVAGPPGKPASIEEVRALLFALRRDLVSYQAMGGNAGWVKAIRDAQAELANRLGIIAEKVDRIDRRINNGRPASPAADPARPS